MKLAADVMKKAFNEEVVTTIKADLSDKYTESKIDSYAKKFINKEYEDLPDKIKNVGIAVSYDMGWNKRSIGRVYYSLSGHGFIIGCKTGNIIRYGASKEQYSQCRFVNTNNLGESEAHLLVCIVNSIGSSGAMGSQVVLDPTKKVFDDSGGRVYAKFIVLDDDSSMRAHLQHPSTDDRDKLP